MDEPFEGPADWAELCTYIGGRHREVELTPSQHAVVSRLLGLDEPEPYPDEYLAGRLLPALLEALRSLPSPNGDAG